MGDAGYMVGRGRGMKRDVAKRGMLGMRYLCVLHVPGCSTQTQRTRERMGTPLNQRHKGNKGDEYLCEGLGLGYGGKEGSEGNDGVFVCAENFLDTTTSRNSKASL